MTCATLEAEFQDILVNHPSASYLELLFLARERGWNLDKLTPRQEAYAATVPAWQALFMAKVHNECSARKLGKHEQILPTGAAYQHDDVITPDSIRILIEFFNQQVAASDSAPLELSQIRKNENLDIREFLINLSRSVLEGIARDPILRNAVPEGNRFTILMNRCLLRRTYSMLDNMAVIKNRNNQHWHQDSNGLFQNRPMLTIWAPLQQGAGESIPGLEIAKLSVDRFIPRLGDGAEHLEDICDITGKINQNTRVALVKTGGCLVFNGLTFHRTYTTSDMVGLRDALLVRICPEIHAAYFPGNRTNDLFFSL